MAARWLDKERSGSCSALEGVSSRREDKDHTWMSESSEPERTWKGVATTTETDWTWRAGVEMRRPVEV